MATHISVSHDAANRLALGPVRNVRKKPHTMCKGNVGLPRRCNEYELSLLSRA